MIGFEVHVNGKPLCLASVGEAGVLMALLTWVARAERDVGQQGPDALTLHVTGGSGPLSYTWPSPPALKVGDVVQVRIVSIESADEALRTAAVERAPEGQVGWFDAARAKYGKSRR